MDQTFMKERPILPLMISMALPMTISMLVNSLYNIVDSYFVAQISENAMTALSLVYPVQNLVTAVTVGCGVGINAVIAFYLGAGQKSLANTAAGLGMLLNTLHGVLLTVGCLGAMPWFLTLFTEDTAVFSLAMQYSRITLLFCVPIAIGITFEKIFQAVGQMTVSMASMMIGCVTNILLDPVLIFGLGPFPAMGITGAAIATGFSQVLTLVIYLIFYFTRSMPVRLTLEAPHAFKNLCCRIYMVGIPATLSLALPSLLISALNAILSAFGQTYVLVLGAYYKLQTFLYLTASGVVQGMRPLVAYNYGAGEFRRLRGIFRTGLGLILSVMVLGTVLCLAAPQFLIGLFTANQETIHAGSVALRIISIGFIVSAVTVNISGMLEGLGEGFPSLVISLLRYVLLIIPLAFLFSRHLGPTGVWHAFWVTEFITALLSYLLFRKHSPWRSHNSSKTL